MNENLTNLIAQLKQNAGANAEAVKKEMDAAKEKYQKNANEVEHTTNVGFGKELVPVDVLTGEIISMVPTYGTFINALSGFQGANMGTSEKRAVIGEIGFAYGNTEWTTGAGLIGQGRRKLPTDNVTINQVDMIAQVDISKRLLNHSIVDLEMKVKQEIAASYARTIESMILNADSSDLAIGNVNLDDAQPSVTFTDGADDHRLLLDDGLRKTFLSGTVDVDYKDVGALSWNDFIEVRALMDVFSYDLAEMLLLMNGSTYNKALTLDEFKKANENGMDSTIYKGAISNIAGVDLYVARDYPKTEADGKVSVNPALNTKGGFLYLRRSAVQYGYGQAIELDTVKIPGKGISIIATQEFGFAVVNKKAGQTAPRVVGGINVTL